MLLFEAKDILTKHVEVSDFKTAVHKCIRFHFLCCTGCQAWLHAEQKLVSWLNSVINNRLTWMLQNV
jgi:hypothetical protein